MKGQRPQLDTLAVERRRDSCYGGIHIRFDAFSFGSIRIDGITYEYDVVIDQRRVQAQRRRLPMAAFQTHLGLGGARKSTAYKQIRGAADLHNIVQKNRSREFNLEGLLTGGDQAGKLRDLYLSFAMSSPKCLILAC